MGLGLRGVVRPGEGAFDDADPVPDELARIGVAGEDVSTGEEERTPGSPVEADVEELTPTVDVALLADELAAGCRPVSRSAVQTRSASTTTSTATTTARLTQ